MLILAENGVIQLPQAVTSYPNSILTFLSKIMCHPYIKVGEFLHCIKVGHVVGYNL